MNLYKENLTLEMACEWRPHIWSHAVQWAFDGVSPFAPKGSKVLEVGFNSGMMSCYMAQKFDWEVFGHDVTTEQVVCAEELSESYGLSDKTHFFRTPPRSTFSIEGEFDVIFIKSVLFHIRDEEVYKDWLEWLRSKLRHSGRLIVVENCEGHFLDKVYRKYIQKNNSWHDCLLFNRDRLGDFQSSFRSVEYKGFGGFSQYFEMIPYLHKFTSWLDEVFFWKSVNKSFVVSLVCMK